MEFVLHVTMEKNEMHHPRNVARALERLARELDEKFALDSSTQHAEGIIRDVTGSIVGRWEFRP